MNFLKPTLQQLKAHSPTSPPPMGKAWYRYRQIIFTFTLGLTLLLGIYSRPALAVPAKAQRFNTFADWCLHQNNLTPEAQRTVNLLLQVADTRDCDRANQELSSLTEIFLNGVQLSDISPLASLKNVKTLFLSNNPITDISPLASLNNLTTLALSANQIADIRPLASLTQLNHLFLDSNQIADIRPLASLTQLATLSLFDNQISCSAFK